MANCLAKPLITAGMLALLHAGFLNPVAGAPPAENRQLKRSILCAAEGKSGCMPMELGAHVAMAFFLCTILDPETVDGRSERDGQPVWQVRPLVMAEMVMCGFILLKSGSVVSKMDRFPIACPSPLFDHAGYELHPG